MRNSTTFEKYYASEAIDFAAFRAQYSINKFCESRGMRLRPGSWGRSLCLCPFHEETTPSFTVYPDHAHCYGCGWHGDVIDLCAKLDKLTSREAVRKLQSDLTLDQLPKNRAGMGSRQLEPKAEASQLSDAQIKRMAPAAHGLATNDELIKRLITQRSEWTPDAIRGAALDGDLGWEDGKMLFGYSHGIKARWYDTEGKRAIRWLCGSAHGRCWRQSLLLRSHRTVYITEGETDALTLLSFGLEKPGESLVLALAGASIPPEPTPFANREILIVPDLDEAGAKAEAKLRALLEPIAASLLTIPLMELIA